jgi:hypothetical protein
VKATPNGGSRLPLSVIGTFNLPIIHYSVIKMGLAITRS